MKKLFFAPRQLKYYIKLRFVDKPTKIKGTVAYYYKNELTIGKDTHAVCLWNYDTKGYCLGEIIVSKKHATLSTIVHELCHAALNFVSTKSMSSKQVKKMSLIKQDDYFNEAVPSALSNLIDQLDL